MAQEPRRPAENRPEGSSSALSIGPARLMSAIFHYRHASCKNQEIMHPQIFTNI
ncbi:hypothetical protein HMPREF9166_1774 [Selenomonas sp. oral taxon 149 str. 67H29BP]|nr:hypothetical protein HMPREF9166_1774 [Selenomonas sp. oral taxon 149 str. 67H29BP]